MGRELDKVNNDKDENGCMWNTIDFKTVFMSGTLLYTVRISSIVLGFCSDTGFYTSKLSSEFRKFGLIPLLSTQCTLLLCPPSSFGLRWIHAFEGALEFLDAAFLCEISSSFQTPNDYKLLLDDRLQICDMVFHHLAVLDPLLDKCFQSPQGWPLKVRCREFRQ
jgi:hypothetical protein